MHDVPFDCDPGCPGCNTEEIMSERDFQRQVLALARLTGWMNDRGTVSPSPRPQEGPHMSAATWRPWSAEEDATLRRLYRDTPIDQVVQALPGRSRHAVLEHAQKLRLQTWRTWTEAALARIRECYGKVRTRDLARELGRTVSAVKLQAIKMQVRAEDHYYTTEDIELVKRLYATHSAAEIAERILGSRRSAGAIYRMAHRLGLSKQPHLSSDDLERVRAECARGGTDADVAARLGCTRSRVTHVRHRLGIDCDLEAVHAARVRGSRKQLESLGCRNHGELRSLAHHNYARQNGWPEDLRPREVQILNALARAGVPMTALALAEAIGARTDRSDANHGRVLLTGNGPGGTYTASLARCGLILRLPRAYQVLGQGMGRSRDLYTLSPMALAILAERAEQETRWLQPTTETTGPACSG